MKPIVILVLLSLLGLKSLLALEWKTLDVEMIVAWQYNATLDTNDPNSKLPSILMLNLGASAYADFDTTPGDFYFKPGFWLSWGTEDVYQGIARPSGEEKAGHKKVLGLMLDAPFGYALVSKKFHIAFHLGPAFYLRFPLWGPQTSHSKDFWAAYYSKLQFFHLGLGSWVSFPASSNSNFLIGLRSYLPISNLWARIPFSHGINVSLLMGLRFDWPF